VFSFLADDHEVNARILSGSYDDVAKTVALSGCNGDARPRCDAAGGRDSVQTNMAGPQVPDAGAHPTITFSLGDDRHADANRWTVTGTHSLRGRERTPRACALLACRVDESGLLSAITFAS